MSRLILILRTQPGAAASAARAAALGLDPVVAPIFTVEALPWTPPAPGEIDAVMITSAHAPRSAGQGLTPFLRHPAFAVGEASGEAARDAGFSAIEVGPSDGAALLSRIAALGHRRILHPAGRDHVGLAHPDVAINRHTVYVAKPVPALPPRARGALDAGALVLLHSPRAAETFAQMVDAAGLDRSEIPLAAISLAAADAAGPGWDGVHHADRPRDGALLELAAKLCQTGAGAGEEADEMNSDYRPVDEGQEAAAPRRSPLPFLLLAALAFLLGLAAMGWALSSWPSAARYLGLAQESPAPVTLVPAEATVPTPADATAEPQRLVLDPEMSRRVTQLEQRLAEIGVQSRAAVGNADRAEGLLLAFAARRALDRGVALGYLEGLLRQRFGQGQPQAVGTIIAASRQPVTLDQLHQGLQDAETPLIGSGPDGGWWSALRAELDNLVTVRRQGTPSTVPAERYRRAMRRLEAGQVDVALAEVLRMPGRERAQEWIDNARRYVAARRALDTIETAALLEPRALPPQLPPPARGEAEDAPE